MLIFVLPAAAAELPVEALLERSTHVFTATVEAVTSVPAPRYPGVRLVAYGFRIGEELRGHVDGGYLVDLSGEMSDPAAGVVWSSTNEYHLDVGDHVLVFTRAYPDGTLDVSPPGCMESRPNTTTMVARVRGSDGTLLVRDVSSEGVVACADGTPCDWNGLLARLRAHASPSTPR